MQCKLNVKHTNFVFFYIISRVILSADIGSTPKTKGIATVGYQEDIMPLKIVCMRFAKPTMLHNKRTNVNVMKN